MSSKVATLPEAVGELVHDGDVVFVGGFGHAIPFATGHEMIRQGLAGLTLCRSGADILFDQLIAAGTATGLIFGWIGNPGIGLGHGFRRAIASGSISIEEWTNFTLMLRLHAATLGVPFLPTRALAAGDIPTASATPAQVDCPFTGERLTAVPSLQPDVALIHAQRADEKGNVQMWGILGDTIEGALASKRILVTVEELVPSEVIRADPNRTVLPGHRVDAVCEVPWGAHPAYVQGYYTRDDDFYRRYDSISRTEEGLGEYLDEWVLGLAGRAEYVSRLDQGSLVVPENPAPGVNYGFVN